MQEALLKRIAAEAQDVRPERRGQILRQLSDLYLAARGRIERDCVDLFVSLAIDLLGKASLFERMAFANAIADIGPPPAALVDHVLADVYLVARPLIERGDLSESRLLALLDADTREVTHVMIAQRPNTGVPITDRLVADDRIKVLLALAANASATLSEAAFEKLGHLAVERPDMDAALAHRADLPVAIAKRLHRRIGQSSAKRVHDMIARDEFRRRTGYVLRS